MSIVMRFNQDAVIHVGTPPPGCKEEWVTRTVQVHGFESLSTVRGECVDSPEFMLLGNQWLLRLYPGGRRDSAEGMVSLYLKNMSNKAIEIDFGFIVNDGNLKQVAYKRSDGTQNFAPVGSVNPEGVATNNWGFTNFATRLSALRSDLMSSLVNGALFIEIHMKLATPTKSVPPPFIPENPVAKMIQGLFMEDESADTVFEVGGEEQPKNNAMKVAKTAPVAFPAHRLIVAKLSSVFAELCESNGDSTTPIQITGVSPDVFHLLLFYMYGGKVSDDDMKSHAREIIDVADKFGVSSLKLEAEAYVVQATTFSIENVMEHLLYAESKNLALLKEVSMDYIVENKSEVIKKLSFANAPGTLVTDILAAVSRGEMRSGGADVNADSQFDSLHISELRHMAHEKGINVDESREMLIAALKLVQEAVVVQDLIEE